MLLKYKGKSLVRNVIQASLSSELDGAVVVINSEIDGLLQEAMVPGVSKVFLNSCPGDGLSSSVKAGLCVLPAEAEAVIFLLGDQPLITEDEINRLIDEYAKGEYPYIYQSMYHGEIGHPVLFPRKMFSHLLNVRGDKGGRAVMKQYPRSVKYVEMDKEYPFDIDTMKDYKNLLRKEVS